MSLTIGEVLAWMLRLACAAVALMAGRAASRAGAETDDRLLRWWLCVAWAVCVGTGILCLAARVQVTS